MILFRIFLGTTTTKRKKSSHVFIIFLSVCSTHKYKLYYLVSSVFFQVFYMILHIYMIEFHTVIATLETW